MIEITSNRIMLSVEYGDLHLLDSRKKYCKVKYADGSEVYHTDDDEITHVMTLAYQQQKRK
jgi:hypothetical protein